MPCKNAVFDGKFGCIFVGTEGFLTCNMNGNCTITLEELTDYADGHSEAVNADRLRAHLSDGCPLCSERMALLAQGLTALRDALTPPLAPIPAAARLYARALGRLTRPDSDETTGFLKRVARLVFDGGRPAPNLAYRGAEGSAVRTGVQRLYETEEHLVMLWEERTQLGSSYLIGQIYQRLDGVCLTQASVVLTATHSGTTQTARQQEGEFHVEDVAPGMYLIECWLDSGADIVLRDVRVGEA